MQYIKQDENTLIEYDPVTKKATVYLKDELEEHNKMLERENEKINPLTDKEKLQWFEDNYPRSAEAKQLISAEARIKRNKFLISKF